MGAEQLAVEHADPRPADVMRHFADTAKARALFGFVPKTDLRTGLGRTIEWFDANGIAGRSAPEAAGAPNW